jgi:peptidoglycan/xylan/chitin deacetylase (PgdA/CDA1 family)
VTVHAALTRASLGALSRPVQAFVRDDDAGWGDEPLWVLLDLFEESGMPIDLAAIPVAIDEDLARRLCERIDAGAQVGVHQHGFSHTNHEITGRKCEFGVSRPEACQRVDLEQGWLRLYGFLGDRADRLFTPPWNRCAPWTPGLLAELGYQALSREHRATPTGALSSVDVCLDWGRVWREGGAMALDAAFAQAVLDSERTQRPLGLMLHHAAMSDGEFEALRGWLRVLQEDPLLHWRPMRELLTPCSPPPPSGLLQESFS